MQSDPASSLIIALSRCCAHPTQLGHGPGLPRSSEQSKGWKAAGIGVANEFGLWTEEVCLSAAGCGLQLTLSVQPWMEAFECYRTVVQLWIWQGPKGWIWLGQVHVLTDPATFSDTLIHPDPPPVQRESCPGMLQSRRGPRKRCRGGARDSKSPNEQKFLDVSGSYYFAENEKVSFLTKRPARQVLADLRDAPVHTVPPDPAQCSKFPP